MPQSVKQALLLLEKLGKKALQPYMKKDYRGRFLYYDPAINRTMAKELRNLFLTHDEPWPFEDIYPGLQHDIPPVPRTKHEKARIAREKRIEKIKENMADMDRKIAEYRESRKLKNVSLLDQLTLTKKQQRQKYLRSQKQSK